MDPRSCAFINRVAAMVRREPRRGRRRESRLLQSLPLLRVVEIVCAFYKVERTELSRAEARHPARATLAYLARSRTISTNADLAVTLGLGRRGSACPT